MDSNLTAAETADVERLADWVGANMIGPTGLEAELYSLESHCDVMIAVYGPKTPEPAPLTQDQAWAALQALEAAHPFTAAIKALEAERYTDPAIVAARKTWFAAYSLENDKRERAELDRLAGRLGVTVVDPVTYDADMTREAARLFPSLY